MQKKIITLSIILLYSSLYSMNIGFGGAIQSKITDSQNSQYFVNNSNNKLLNGDGKVAANRLEKDAKGNYTEASIKVFQKSHNLTVDGKIGQQTAAALNNTQKGQISVNDGLTAAPSPPAAEILPSQAGGNLIQNSTTNPSQESTQEDNVVYVTERVPGGDCTCGVLVEGKFTANEDTCQTITTRLYECKVTPGMDSFKTLMAQLVGYFIRIVLLLGVLAIVGLGIAWAWAGGDDIKAKTKLKGWAVNIVVGLAILFFFGYILKFLAPWIYQ